ncbi:MAG: ATP-binding protein [Fimbriimonadales bacterium]
MYRIDILMRDIGATLAVALAYFVLGQVSLRFIQQEAGTASLVWLPSGLAVASVWWFGWRGIVGSALGAGLVTYAHWGIFSFQVILLALGVGVEFTVLWVLLRVLGFQSTFTTPRDLITFATSLVIAGAIAAFWQTKLSLHFEVINTRQFLHHYLVWLGGNLIGGLLLGTLLLLLRSEWGQSRWGLKRIAEFTGFVSLCVFGILTAYLLGQERNGLYYILALLPLLIAVAFRYERAESIIVLNVMLFTMVVAQSMSFGSSPLARQTIYDLWVFLVIAYIVMMTISISQSQHRLFTAFTEQSQRELQQAYEQLEAIIENSPTVAIQGYDLEGRVVFWNRASEQMYGYRQEDAIGKTLDQLIFTPEESIEYLEMLHEVADTGQPTPLREWEIVTATGERRYILSSLFPVWWRDRRIVICADVDITERKRLEAQLWHAQKMESIGRLAGGIAHDFNNLLTVIQGFAELAQSKLPPEHPAQTDLERIMQAVERAASLTRQLLAFAGKAIVQPTPIDVHQIAHDMLPLFQRTLGEKIQIETDLRADRAIIKADRSQLEQVLMNLVVNARDAMPNGGTIRIMTRIQPPPDDCQASNADNEPTGFLCLCVQDTGSGISEEDLEHIFEPFFTTKGSRGYGLGLATVYGIVNQLGGCIDVESKMGQGTTFHIYLPLCSGDQVANEQPARLREPVRVVPLTVLLVEDEPAVRESLATALSMMGYTVLSASHAEQALEMPLEQVEVLLTDVVLPGKSGYELASQLAERFPDLKCLFMTGYAEEEPPEPLPVKWKILTKPFRMEQLRQALTELLAS